jgi:hypothetical protein
LKLITLLVSLRPEFAFDMNMHDAIDFSNGRRGPALPRSGTKRIIIYLDNEIFETLQAESARTGVGYQALINENLARYTCRSREFRDLELALLNRHAKTLNAEGDDSAGTQ